MDGSNRIFEFFYPENDVGGYHFISIIVWETNLDRHDKVTGWNIMPTRILEGRFVVNGNLKHFVLECASDDSHNSWAGILEYAERLKEGWMKAFPIAEKLMRENHK